jgi:Family of unknown function (DUF5989)
MRVLANVATGTSTVRELLQFLWGRKLYWLIPFVITLLLVGALLLVGQVTGVAPFIYTLF